MHLYTGTSVPLLHQVAKFAERRQDVLAGNIANISTPDYKVRDLPVDQFQKALKNATEGGSSASLGSAPKPLASDVSAHFGDELFQAVQAPPQGITFHDGGNRSIEHQMMEMTKNSLLYNTAVELMKLQLNRLQAVISERP